MKKQHVRTVLPWIAVVVWMGVIFLLSQQAGSESGDLSGGMTDAVIQVIQTGFPFVPIDEAFLHHLIRKGAHFTAYLLLGVLVINALGLPYGKKVVLALILCILYAISDEVHQLFIPGRSGELRDVIIDSTGAATGIGVYILCVFIFRRFFEKKRNKERMSNG